MKNQPTILPICISSTAPRTFIYLWNLSSFFPTALPLFLLGRVFCARAEMKRQTKLQKGFKPINLRSVCGFFHHQHRPSSVYHLASFSSFFQPTQKRNAKVALISPEGLGLFCSGTDKHIPSNCWMRNRDRHMECTRKARPDGPL